jgi:hypothetical protein
VVRIEGDERPLLEAEPAQALHEPFDLRVHVADRFVVLVLGVPDERRFVDARSGQLFRGRYAALGEQGVGDYFFECLELAQVLLAFFRVRLYRVEGSVGLVRGVGVEEVEVYEHARVGVQVEPPTKRFMYSRVVLLPRFCAFGRGLDRAAPRTLEN